MNPLQAEHLQRERRVELVVGMAEPTRARGLVAAEPEWDAVKNVMRAVANASGQCGPDFGTHVCARQATSRQVERPRNGAKAFGMARRRR